MATTPIQGLRFSPSAASREPINVGITADDFNKSANWVISTASKQLGLPVKVGPYAMPDEAQEVNKTARSLLLNADITSPSFALPPAKPFRGSIIVARCDGHPLNATTIAAVVGKTLGYIAAARDRFRDVESGVQTLADYYAEAKAQFTRESAVKLYRDLKEGAAAYVNPFKITPPGGIKFCDSCGAVKAKSGRALLLCGVCRQGRYCGKVCQKREWKTHRAACKKR